MLPLRLLPALVALLWATAASAATCTTDSLGVVRCTDGSVISTQRVGKPPAVPGLNPTATPGLTRKGVACVTDSQGTTRCTDGKVISTQRPGAQTEGAFAPKELPGTLPKSGLLP